MLIPSCDPDQPEVVSDHCDAYIYERYSEATKDFWRTTEDPGAQQDRLRTAKNQKTFRCLCPDYHNEGTEGCPQ